MTLSTLDIDYRGEEDEREMKTIMEAIWYQLKYNRFLHIIALIIFGILLVIGIRLTQ